MKPKSSLIIILPAVFILFSLNAFSQAGYSILQMGHSTGMMATSGYSHWFGLMELPFLFISVFFAFSTASALKGGKFGKGMNLVAWGFLVMAVGHLHMQIEHIYGVNLFQSLLGSFSGSIAWFLALIITWGLSGLGFYSIYKASKGA